VAAGGRMQGNARRHLNRHTKVSGMKKVLLVALIASLALAVAAPSYASRGREVPPTAHVAKKKCKKKAGAKKKKKCKKKKRVVTPPAPTPKPLTDAEVVPWMIQRAAVYCADDPMFCVNYGYYYDATPGVAACTSKSTYQWACLGWNDEETGGGGDPDLTCAFREIIDRVGIDGLTSHQDLSFNPPDGWSCGPWEGQP
jgi:hypothetical protein